MPDNNAHPSQEGKTSILKDSNGWDGKLRVERNAVIQNPEALSDPEYSDEDAPPVEEISADEGRMLVLSPSSLTNPKPSSDLLEEYDSDAEDVDLVHLRISSTKALKLEKFRNLERLCLRQNQISNPVFPENVLPTLQELDLYDNLINHIKGFEGMTKLTSLDLSFNKIKHIKHIDHLTELTDLYFVQNKISKIEHLETLVKMRMLELGANRIREIENLDSLQNLKELWLGKNKITELKNLSTLSNLRVLSIQSNRLSSIKGLQTLQNLEELYISHNLLSDLSGLESNEQLRILDVSSNKIEHLDHISHLQHLEEFWASSNQISSFEEVEKQLADKKELETVYFEGNPLQLRNPVLYRNKVKLALPQIQKIDAGV
ncbi:MAG: hypothetical protein Q9227_000517 [Pyrenula ochraceoflavens]